MASERNAAVIRQLQQTWSDPDPGTFARLFREDGEFLDIPYGIHLRGHAELQAHSARMKKHSRDLRIDIHRCDATAETGVAEWTLSHLYSGRFDGVECTNVPIVIAGLSIYTFADGLIVRAADYWNYMEIVRSVQVMPREMRGMRQAEDWNR